MEQYTVTGMSCAACQARVEKAVNAVEGVESCAVSLLTNSMGVTGTASAEDIIKAVQDAGYDASLKDGGSVQKLTASQKIKQQEEALKDHETPKLVKRLVASLVFLAVLMYITMGHMMLGWPLPSFFRHNYAALGIVQMLLALIVMAINGKFFTSGFKSLLHSSPNMDTLVALGSSVSFLWSLYVLFQITGLYADGSDSDVIMEIYHNQLYFESAAMIPALITVGKMLEARSKGKTTDALKSLLKLAPKTAVLLRDGEEVTVDIDEVNTGDVFVVKPGESIPVDGIVIEGNSAVNESALTGESIPVDKTTGDTVSAATMNTSGYLAARATRVGEDTTLSQIIQMVSDAAATKAPIAKIADTVSGVFVPVVIIIAIAVGAGWYFSGAELSTALERAISVLVISCPCALGLATPVAIMVGNGIGAKNGILFKTSAALEAAGKTQIVALDKTGTITKGEPAVTDVIPCTDTDESTLLAAAYSLEKKSEHPLAKAIVRYGDEQGIQEYGVSDFENLAGSGISGVINSEKVYGGNKKFISTIVNLDSSVNETAEKLADEGKTPMFFTSGKKLLGMIAVADVIKEDSAAAIAALENMGIEVVMLTGDNVRTAKAIGELAGVSEVVAEVLPSGKEAEIQKLQKRGKVAMVGDGINDAPALTRADIGIAIGAGTDVAIDSADIVLMNSSLQDAAAAIRLSRKTLRNIHENLFWAFFYNLLCIPLAAGLFSYQMNPMVGAAAMCLSSFTVCMNALRLNLFNPHSAKHDKAMKNRAYSQEQVEADEMLAEAESSTSAEPDKFTGELSFRIAGINDPEDIAMAKETLMVIPGVEGCEINDRTMVATLFLFRAIDHMDLTKALTDCGLSFAGYVRNTKKETVRLHIEGMMCRHCEARVKEALESIDGVESAVCSHTDDTAEVVLTDAVSEEEIKKVIEDAGYTYCGTAKETFMRTYRISGMMCTHCEAHVKEALEALDGVEKAVCSHEKGEAQVSFTKEVPLEKLQETVKEAGYTLIG